MRTALRIAREDPRGARLGGLIGEVAGGTADALVRRGLAYADGPRLRLTDAGELVADEVIAAHRALLQRHGYQEGTG
jgi:hypothetical protein